MKTAIFKQFYGATLKAIERSVDGKIRRNVVRDKSFKGDLGNVLYTYLKLRQHVDEASVSFDCGTFSISSYPVPKFLVSWVESGKLYFDDVAKGKAKPIYSETGELSDSLDAEFIKLLSGSDEEKDKWSEFTELSPSDVEAFWSRLNLKCEFVHESYKRSDMSKVCRVTCGGSLYEISGSKDLDEEISYLMGITLPADLGQYLRPAIKPTEEEIIEWICTKLKSEGTKTTS